MPPLLLLRPFTACAQITDPFIRSILRQATIVCSTSLQPLPLPSPFSDPATAKENLLQVRAGQGRGCGRGWLPAGCWLLSSGRSRGAAFTATS
jgi:hypothetical protein